MDLIYTDTKGKELGVVYTTLDMEIGEEATNDFEIEYKRSEWDGTVENGCFFYVPETEFGGIVREIKTSTKTNTITAKGYTWRGMMMKKIIEPQSGQDYATATGELNEIVGEKVKEAFPGLFYGSDADTGVQVKDYQFDRYCTLYEGLQKMLQSVGYRLDIKFFQREKEESGYVVISAVPIRDRSVECEFSNDNGLYFTMDNNQRGINHMICLGKGELKDRLVIHLYVDQNGKIGQTQFFQGVDEIADIYDSSSSEYEDLLKGGTERLEKAKNSIEYDLTLETLEDEIDIGDIVGFHPGQFRKLKPFSDFLHGSYGPSFFFFHPVLVLAQDHGRIFPCQFHKLFLGSFFGHNNTNFLFSSGCQPFLNNIRIFYLCLQCNLSRNKWCTGIKLLYKTGQYL